MANQTLYQRYAPSLVPEASVNNSAWHFVFKAGEILVKSSKDGLMTPVFCAWPDLGFEPQIRFYLGKFNGVDCFCQTVDNQVSAPEGFLFEKFRSLLGRLDEDIFMLAGRACQILNWDQKTRFCGSCGAENDLKDNELAKICPKCGNIIYPRISPAVIVAIKKGEKILLASARHFKGQLFSLIAGFVEPGETFEDCVKREVFEEVGIRVKNLRYLGSQPWPFPDSLMVGFMAEHESGEIEADGREIVEAGWFSKENLPKIPNNSAIAGQIIRQVLFGEQSK